jgi:BirA family biotin operon repressor/biotin-[acetyl-CoA-carboxylase] ligase
MEINRISLSEVDSTNNYAAKLLLSAEVAHGTVISALFQNNGRGQRSNIWNAEAGKNITASWILHLKSSQFEDVVILNKALALAMRDAICDWIPKGKVFIKWPNDIYVETKKIAGMLIEIQWHPDKSATLIAGIGINILQENNLPSNATSVLLQNQECDLSLDQTIVELNNHIQSRFEQWEEGLSIEIDDDYHQNLLGKNNDRKFLVNNQEINGTVMGVDSAGRLIVQVNGESQFFQSGEIIWL